MESLKKLRGSKLRVQRSINWIGSAWKWLAGTPDATDWNNVLKSQNELINNNNKQYKINHEIMRVTNQVIEKYNIILKELGAADHQFEQVIFNKLGIIREALNEIVLAAEIAKKGIVNTNLLSRNDIQKILKETDTLPYANEIEAIEYSQPKVVTNGYIILYVLSVPKTSNQSFDHIITRPIAKNSKQVHLEYKDLLASEEIYGITGKCDILNNVTICERSELRRLDEEYCIFQLLKGVDAQCDVQFNKEEVIERIDENTIFLTNFNGEISSGNITRQLTGSFVIQHNNETVQIKGQSFISKGTTSTDVLPAIFQQNLTDRNARLNLEYIHELHLNNTQHIQTLLTNDDFSFTSNIIIFVTITVLIISVILKHMKKRFKSKNQNVVPKAKVIESPIIPPLKLQVNLRDADL